MTDRSFDRISKQNYYLNIAQECGRRGTCLRRNYGAVIVKNDEIISTGYTGSPRGRQNCSDKGTCLREEMNIPSGQRYELCLSVHAEMNACIHARRHDMIGATLFLVGISTQTKELVPDALPCELCKRVLINSGIEEVIIRRTPDEYEVIDIERFMDEEPVADADYDTQI
jgi:dCMP deaminase